MSEFLKIKTSAIKPASVYTTSNINEAVKLRIASEGLSSMKPLSIPNAFNEIVLNYSNNTAMIYKDAKNIFHSISYKQYYEKVIQTAKAFIKIGLKPRATVAVLASNCPEWVYSEVGAIYAGGIITGIYITNSPEAVYHVLNTSKAVIVIVDDCHQIEKILSVRNRLTHLKSIVQIMGPYGSYFDTEKGFYKWSDIDNMETIDANDELKNRIEGFAINQCCNLLYTSGTLGLPKAAMLSHDNLILSARTVISFIPNVKYGQEMFVSYLPLNHIAAQLFDIFVPMLLGGCVHFADGDALKGSLMKTLIKARPTFLFGVPRVWEKLQEKIVLAEMESHGILKYILNWAKSISVDYHRKLIDSNNPVSYPQYWFAKEILNVVKSWYGFDKCKYFLTGAAPTSIDTKEFFQKYDINIAEIFGLTESSGGISFGHPLIPNFIASGRPANGIQIKILDPNELNCGEVCIKGRNIFMGYLNQPAKTAEAIDNDGWLHSGDQGMINYNDDLVITGRLKEIIITKGGENISPAYVESLVKRELPFISNAFLVGDNQKYLIILLSIKTEMNLETGEPMDKLHPETLEWLEKHKLKNYQYLSEIVGAGPCPNIMFEIENGIKVANSKAISKAQRVQKFKILPHDFSVVTGELGPTLKVRRDFVNKMYSNIINEIYKY